jgi:GAF domain-containing protein
VTGDFTAHDLELVQALADQVAIAIENASMYQEMRLTFLGVTTALAEASGAA